MNVVFEQKRFLAPRNEARRTETVPPEPVPTGLDGWMCDLIGWWKSRPVESKRLWVQAGELEVICRQLEEMTEKDLRARLRERRSEVRRRGGGWVALVPEVLPYVVEAARRSLGLRAYRTQIMGALAIGGGSLVEMATGEGKTLTIALAAAVAGWSGKPCHVITANDYLARRDAETLALFFNYCGLNVAAIAADLTGPARQQVYRADVVYCTGKELVADYLRDQITLGPMADSSRRAMTRLLGQPFTRGDQVVLRGLYTAIIDEADNQMIDEAVTPLIISRQQENRALVEACAAADSCAAALLPGEHYEVNERFRETRLLPQGREAVAAWCQDRQGLLKARDWMADLVTQSLQARHFFLRDRQYVMVDGKVVIVDEFTGRLMPGRSWRLGLHQAVEAKEGSEISEPSETLARLSFQNFYRYFPRISGITGTAFEARREFWRIYRLPFIKVPHHKPNLRIDQAPGYFSSEDAKWSAIVDGIEAEHRNGRPVLVGTRSVAASEQLGRLLDGRGMSYTILNAVRHQEEANIILRAGDAMAVTIATNMAGRGSDIRLENSIARKGGLHVILTEGHESGRVDRQLRGRAARQGAPGSSQLMASFDDELYQRHLDPAIRNLIHFWVRFGLPGQQILLAFGFCRAQKRAERRSRRQRFMLMEQDQEIAKSVIGGGAKTGS